MRVNMLPKEAIFRSRTGEERILTIRRCEARHLDAILALQEEVFRTLPADALFVRETAGELEESLALDVCLGAFDGDELAAFSLMIANRLTHRSLGAILGYETARMKETVTYDSTFVSPSYRGFGLQRAMLPVKDDAARSLGALEALATVSPDNVHSMNNLLSDGFSILRRQRMYGGLDRYIVRKLLGKE